MQISDIRSGFRRAYTIWCGALTFLVIGCAGSTLGSGVGDRVLRHPPYYAGAGVGPGAARIGRLPVDFQRGAVQEPIFDPSAGAGTPVAALLSDMNRYLDSLGIAPIRVSAVQPRTPPDVRFGCNTDVTVECKKPENNQPELLLAVGRPTKEWASWLAAALSTSGFDQALLITLEVGQYWPRQKNVLGEKEIELGTGYVLSLPWLTSLDAPVQVLQITGALIGPDGKAVRIGAEGLLARRTNLLLSGFGGQALITDEDVTQLRSARRDDLPGRPLVWQAALRNLVGELTGR